MRVAGIRHVGAPVEMIEVSDPRPLAGDEVLLDVKAAGVANWDELVRTGQVSQADSMRQSSSADGCTVRCRAWGMGFAAQPGGESRT
jgi:NADPH:quinone reductase-like Zn-dependent oxidoreductase